MKNIAKSLIEYDILISMKGIGEKLAPRFIAEVGDIRRFHSSSVLIASACIDAPTYHINQDNFVALIEGFLKEVQGL